MRKPLRLDFQGGSSLVLPMVERPPDPPRSEDAFLEEPWDRLERAYAVAIGTAALQRLPEVLLECRTIAVLIESWMARSARRD